MLTTSFSIQAAEEADVDLDSGKLSYNFWVMS